MEKQYKKIRLEQMDQLLRQFEGLAEVVRPQKGWIRAIRESIGMSGRQLARRLHRVPSARVQIEQSEADGRITLTSLSKAAEALDCTVVYALVPNRSLKEMVQQQAYSRAEALVASVSHTMSLEDQRPDESALKQQIEALTRTLTDDMPKDLWDD